MLEYLSAEDRSIIGRSILLLLLFLIVGIIAVENQMNSLTKQALVSKVFNLQHDKNGLYEVGILGKNYCFKGAYSIGFLQLRSNHINVIAAGKVISIPTVIAYDITPMVLFSRQLLLQLRQEAYEVKEMIKIGILSNSRN